MEKSCCFFGHRDTPESVKPKLTGAIMRLIVENGVTDFYVGNQGRFDSLVLSVIKEIAIEFPQIRYTVVLAYLPDDRNAVTDTNTVYPEGLENVPRRFCIARRNDWMIRKAKYVICYVDHITGGAARFMEKARRQNKVIVNIALKRP